MPLKPMLASVATEVPISEDMIIEPKLDGWRATWENGDFHTRTGKTITSAPYLSAAVRAALEGLPPTTILDGEIVDLRSGAGGEWNRTQSILSRNKPHVPTDESPPLSYVIFDVLDGPAGMAQPLRARRAMLPLMVKLINDPNVIGIESWPCDGNSEAVYARIVEQGFEGVVVKHLESPYLPGARNGSWLKIKPELEMDVEVTGTYPPEKGSKYENNAVGGIEFLATHNDGTQYAGRCAGMNDELRSALHVEPESFVGKVAVVAYASVGAAGALRFPRFKRFRDEADKSVAELPVDSDSAKMMLLERALTAEGEVKKLKKENDELRERIEALFDDPKLAKATHTTGFAEAAAQGRAQQVAAGQRLTPHQRITREQQRERATGVAGGFGGQITPVKTPQTSAGQGRKRRNYKAMERNKLSLALNDLQRGAGEGHDYALNTEAAGGWSVTRHIREATTAAREKGLNP